MVNQTALALCVSGASIGYLVNDARGAAWGLIITCGLCILIDMIPSRR